MLGSNGTVLSDITPRAGPETVYNFEVAGEHVYYVGTDGLLVHNAVYLTKVFENGVPYVRNTRNGQFAAYAKKGIPKKQPSRLNRVHPNAANKAALGGAYFKNAANSNGLRKGYHWGHLSGMEHRKLVAAADQLGLSQKQFNKYIQANAKKIFEVQSAKRNLSHKGEDMGTDISKVLQNMRDFFGK